MMDWKFQSGFLDLRLRSLARKPRASRYLVAPPYPWPETARSSWISSQSSAVVSLTNLIPFLQDPSVSVPEFPGGGRDRHAVSPPLSCSRTIVSLSAFSCLRDSSSPQTHFSRPLFFYLNWDLLWIPFDVLTRQTQTRLKKPGLTSFNCVCQQKTDYCGGGIRWAGWVVNLRALMCVCV